MSNKYKVFFNTKNEDPRFINGIREMACNFKYRFIDLRDLFYKLLRAFVSFVVNLVWW